MPLKQAKALGVPVDKLPRPSKYGNTPTTVDGIRFDSKREADRYKQLRSFQHFGVIKGLKVHTRWKIGVIGDKTVFYEDDFSYYEPDTNVSKRWNRVVEDVKGYRTKEYLRKKRAMLEIYGIKIREV